MVEDNPYAPPGSEDQPAPLPPGTPPQQQRWPKVIGIISCVLAGVGLVSSPLMMAFNELNPDSQRFLRLLPDWFDSFSTGSMLVGLLFGVLLLVAGFMTIRKRALSRSLHLVYAWYGLLSVIATIGATISAFGGIETTYLSAAEQAGVIGGMVGGIFGAAFGAAYPIFIIVWFRRQKIRDDIAQWVLLP